MSRLIARLCLYASLFTERRQLRSLPREALDDIGLTKSAAAREAARNPFDVPASRRLGDGVNRGQGRQKVRHV